MYDFLGTNVKNLYINRFSNADEFEECWKLLDNDDSGYLDRKEFLEGPESKKAWENYSSNDTHIHKEYL